MTDPSRPGSKRSVPARRAFLRGLATVGVAAAGVATGASSRDIAAQERADVPPTLPSAIRLDRGAKAVTLPMYRGLDASGRTVYFVITEASRIDEATRRGTNWAPKLRNALGTPAVQSVDRRLQPPWARTQSPPTFPATPEFDPASAPAPAVGGADYTPLATVQPMVTDEGVVYNAPHVANATGRHPAVGRLDRDDMTVRLRLTEGFHAGERVLFATTEATAGADAAREGVTLAPALAAAPAPGDRTLETSAREAALVVTNGPTGADNPQRQGTESTARGEGDALDVLVSNQVCGDADAPVTCSMLYSPLWDRHELRWTDAAIDAGRRRRVASRAAAIEQYEAGNLVSATPDGPANPLLANVPASQALVNGPLVDAVGSD